MSNPQPGILAEVPLHARYLTFQLIPGARPEAALRALAARGGDDALVVGIGPAVVSAMKCSIPGLHEPPALAGEGLSIPSTPAALWCWLRGAERGELLHRGMELTRAVGEAFALEAVLDGFLHDGGRDLTGYEDGTENPKGEEAVQAAIVSGAGPGLDGGSFVAVQQWRHDLPRFQAFPAQERDHIIGRRISDNEELDDAPKSAHVKRTAQESFDPEAFVLRRSMPWVDGERNGLNFVAFGRSLDAFEAQLRRMAGMDDGLTDALFRFTRPLGTSYFWCPPAGDGGLNLHALGL